MNKYLKIGLVLAGGFVAFKIYNKYRRDKVFRESIEQITTENPQILD